MIVELISKILFCNVLEKNQNGGDIADGAGVDFFGFLAIFPVKIKWIFTNRVLQRSFNLAFNGAG
jgi:hypothetical protein